MSDVRFEGRVAVIDIPTMQEVGRVTLGPGKLSLVYSSRRKALFVAHEDLGELTVVDPLGKKATWVVIELSGLENPATVPSLKRE